MVGANDTLVLMDTRRAYLLLVVVIVFWAGNYPLGKLGLQDLGPLTLTGARTLLTAPLPRALARDDYAAFLVLGLSGLVANTTVWYLGLKHTTALNAGIVGASSPIFVGVAAALVLGDRLSRRNWLGIGLSVLAVLVTVAKGSPAVLFRLEANRGDLLILASQSAWVVYSLYSRAAASTLPSVWVMAGANVVGGSCSSRSRCWWTDRGSTGGRGTDGWWCCTGRCPSRSGTCGSIRSSACWAPAPP